MQLTSACSDVAADTGGHSLPDTITGFQKLKKVTSIYQSVRHSTRKKLLSSSIAHGEELQEIFSRHGSR